MGVLIMQALEKASRPPRSTTASMTLERKVVILIVEAVEMVHVTSKHRPKWCCRVC